MIRKNLFYIAFLVEYKLVEVGKNFTTAKSKYLLIFSLRGCSRYVVEDSMKSQKSMHGYV